VEDVVGNCISVMNFSF